MASQPLLPMKVFLLLLLLPLLCTGAVVGGGRNRTAGWIGVQGFDSVATKQALLYSFAAYCKTTTVVERFSCPYCQAPAQALAKIYWLDNPAQMLHGFVGRVSGSSDVIVAFRGTIVSNIVNWKNNIDAAHDPLALPNAPSTVQVHRGFQRNYLVLQQQYLAALSAVGSDPVCAASRCRVRFMGHSMGGALATFAALDFLLRSPAKLYYGSITTFGSPRVGDKAFAAWAAQRLGSLPTSTRVVNNNDVVPSLPVIPMGFQHIPSGVWEKPARSGEPDTYYLCSDSGAGEDSYCILRLADSVADHLKYMQVALDSSSC